MEPSKEYMQGWSDGLDLIDQMGLNESGKTWESVKDTVNLRDKDPEWLSGMVDGARYALAKPERA